MIIYTVIHKRIGEHGELVDFKSTFESFYQAMFWARELESGDLPVRWEFDFVKAPKQYEFMF